MKNFPTLLGRILGERSNEGKNISETFTIDDKCKICVPFPPSKCSKLILFSFPQSHSIQTTTRTGLHCCEKSKCKSICHIVQLLLQEIKKTETSYLKLTYNAILEVMAMKRATFVGY